LLLLLLLIVWSQNVIYQENSFLILILLLLLRCMNIIGLTEHSGCPVYEGEKKIVTQWIRLGVDKENPYDSFNTLGVKEDETDD